MIKVKVTYFKETKKNNDFYFFTDFEVSGHAREQDCDRAIKCCAGVTAILIGMRKIVSGIYDKLEISKGYFHYTSEETPFINKKLGVELDTHYALNTILYQLYEISLTYPEYFKDFIYVERKKQNASNKSKCKCSNEQQ